MRRQQKPFAFFDNIDTFKSKKISASLANDKYIDYADNETIKNGKPDIMFETICVIDRENVLFTHGKFYADTRIPWLAL
jgi:G:T-mismatch repair DNA endonuclease (very short patch repair protein)